jgi:hypothetical protein
MRQSLCSPTSLHLPRARSLMPTFQSWFWEARTRILLGYIFLLVGLVLAALPLMYYRVLAQVDARVLESIAEELESFEQLRSGKISASDRSNFQFFVSNELQEKQVSKPLATHPQTLEDLKLLMVAFLEYRIPEDDTFLIAVVDGEFYKSSPRGLPEQLQPGQPILRQLKQIDVQKSGEILSAGGLGKLLYKVEPVKVGDHTLGALLIVHTTQGEREEALNSLYEVIQVLIGLTIVALALGWWLSGRVLAPLGTLSSTAQQVSEANLVLRGRSLSSIQA